MKNAVSILWASLILLQSFSKVGIILSFKINQDYIAKVLCINRDQPKIQCNGKCILMQRIKAEEESQKKGIPQKLREQKEIIYCLKQNAPLIEGLGAWANKGKKTFYYQAPFSSAFIISIFRPPKFSPTQMA